ncbi:MAG: DNA polymerase III subunit [Verrucomicrobiae bacterium]|nr:DNA polymerase III subunit [Verrucomicrobiae bacterium]
MCALLKRSLQNQRVHHAYLLSGDESAGERLGMGFAQALNCEKNNGDFCGICEGCRAIAGGRYADVHHVKPESRSRSILVGQIRELEKSLFLKASQGRCKVAVIHSADRLMEEAQNAFLKTLEEPPAQTVILLLTSEAARLRETIISRCLVVPLRPEYGREKSAVELEMETWLAEFHDSRAEAPAVFRAYRLAGCVLGELKRMKDEALESMSENLKDAAYENLEPQQRERLKERFEAQAQADYIRERGGLLRSMQEWYHRQPQFWTDARGAVRTRPFEIIERLSRRLNQNVNESLAWEVALLELAGEQGGEGR